jgi:hypothetical protein
MVSKDEAGEARRRIVKAFYDLHGWKKDGRGRYQDEADFEDSRAVTYPYRKSCNLRVKRFLAPQGDFLLDAASGSVQYPEYLEYSAGYRKRVCIDFSLRALQEARDRLGDHGVYVTRLPFRPEVFDPFVSLTQFTMCRPMSSLMFFRNCIEH